MDVRAACEQARQSAAAFDLSDALCSIRISGSDRSTFLQPLVSNDVLALPVGTGHQNALLDRQSNLIALFQLYALEQAYLLIVERSVVEALREALTFYHFNESVEISAPADGERILAVQGPESGEQVAALLGMDAAPPYLPQRSYREDGSLLSLSLTGDEGYLLLEPPLEPMPALAPLDALDILRVEAGQLRHGRDLTPETRVLDAGLGLSTVNYDKGCFPGQEIVARIHSRGEPPRRCVALLCEDCDALEEGEALFLEDREVGVCRSVCMSPRFGGIAIAVMLRKHARETGKPLTLTCAGSPVEVRVSSLPIYHSPSIARAAAAACADGTAAYHDERFEDAISDFERALTILPHHADAMEGIGLCLERMERTDDAIRANKQYADAHPGALMAHTNLSRLYMLKGWKEKAEDEQTRATMIKFQQAAGSGVDMAELEAQRKEQAAKDRARKTALFTQVLEFDAEDEVANFGMGSILVEAGDFDAALPHLVQVVRNNGEYSAAHELLGRALLGAGYPGRAILALQEGIAVARRRGDLMPLTAMEGTLRELEASASEG